MLMYNDWKQPGRVNMKAQQSASPSYLQSRGRRALPSPVLLETTLACQ